VLEGTVCPCCFAEMGGLLLSGGTVVLRWRGVAVLFLWLDTAGNFCGYVFGLFCEFCVWECVWVREAWPRKQPKL